MNGCYDFKFWCQKVLPLVYDESLSYYEVLCKLMEYMRIMFSTQENFENKLKELEEAQGTLNDNFEELKNEFNNLQENVNEQLKEMQDLLDSIKNGDYVDLYLDSIKNYIDENLQTLVKGIVNYISFGLTADGYFCAYIPETWDFIEFSTIDYGEPLEGHLVLSW